MMDFNPALYPPAAEEERLKAEAKDRCGDIIRRYEESQGDVQVLAGQVLTLACEQSGSRFLQAEVAKGDPSFVSFILQEVLKAVLILRSAPTSLN